MTLPTTFSRQNDATSRARTTKRLLHLLSPSPLGSLILRLSSFKNLKVSTKITKVFKLLPGFLSLGFWTSST